jgi:ferritin
MISPRLEKAMNNHLNEEIFSAYLYFSMSAYFKSLGLDGFGKWMQIQGIEEWSHANKFYNFIIDRGGKVSLMAVAGPETSWESPLIAFKDTLAHEELITSYINALVDLAAEEKDHAADIFLQWFVTEQVEEEATAGKIIQQLNLLENYPGGLYHLDQELSARTVDPALLFPGMFGVLP